MIISIIIIALSSIGMLLFARLMFYESKKSTNKIIKVLYAIAGIAMSIAAVSMSAKFIPLEMAHHM